MGIVRDGTIQINKSKCNGNLVKKKKEEKESKIKKR